MNSRFKLIVVGVINAIVINFLSICMIYYNLKFTGVTAFVFNVLLITLIESIVIIRNNKHNNIKNFLFMFMGVILSFVAICFLKLLIINYGNNYEIFARLNNFCNIDKNRYALLYMIVVTPIVLTIEYLIAFVLEKLERNQISINTKNTVSTILEPVFGGMIIRIFITIVHIFIINRNYVIVYKGNNVTIPIIIISTVILVLTAMASIYVVFKNIYKLRVYNCIICLLTGSAIGIIFMELAVELILRSRNIIFFKGIVGIFIQIYLVQNQMLVEIATLISFLIIMYLANIAKKVRKKLVQ